MEFEQIYSTYFKSVYRYVWKLSGDEQTAEEITSETFLKVMKSIGDFRGECDMRVWICQIAKNTYYSYLKKKRKTVSIDETELQNITDPKAFIEERIGIQDESFESKSEEVLNSKNEVCGQKIILYNLKYHKDFAQDAGFMSWGCPKDNYLEVVVELEDGTLQISNQE